MLTVDNDYCSEHINISEDIKIVPMRIEKYSMIQKKMVNLK